MQPPVSKPRLAVGPVSSADTELATGLAQRLGLPLLTTGTDPVSCKQVDAILMVNSAALCLQQTGRGAPGPIAVDFGSAAMRHRRRSGSRELLGRAVGHGKKSPLRVLDATAGLGRDAFVLADLGCEVMLCERNPIILELLSAGLGIASGSGDPWLAGVTQRMHLCAGDARETTPARMRDVDVIYLDPMFPQREKNAAVKKEMALFQVLLERSTEPCNADALLRWALQQERARVVIKRPVRAPNITDLRPSHCIRGKSVRYDVYVHRKLF